MTAENIGAFIAIIASIVITIGGGATIIITTGMRIREMRAHADNDGIKRDIETENMLRAELKAAATKSDNEATEARKNHEKAMDMIRGQGDTITNLRIELVKAQQKIEAYGALVTENATQKETITTLGKTITGLQGIVDGLRAEVVDLKAKYTADMEALRAEHAAEIGKLRAEFDAFKAERQAA